MERDGLHAVRRPRGERTRWLCSVLIVTAIAGATVAVHVWPVRLVLPAPPTVAVLPARTRPIVAAAPALVPAPPPAPHAPAQVAAPPAPAVPVAAGDMAVIAAGVEQVTTPASEPMANAVASDAPLLASGRLAVSPGAVPAVTFAPAVTDAADPFYEFVELPAVVVTRAVSVAGRGIMTGLRATTAVFRAAF